MGQRTALKHKFGPVFFTSLVLFFAMLLSSYSRGEVRIRQITPPKCQSNASPAIDAEGKRIAFMSNCNLTGENPNGDFHIFLWQEDRRPNPFVQITIGSGVSSAPSISADGKRIAFASDLDLTGENPGRLPQIFLWVEGRTPNAFAQITPRTTQGFNAQPRISGDGGRIAFESLDDLAPNDPGNEDSNNEIFLWIEGRTPRPFVQITDTLAANFFIFFANFDGTRIGFHSSKPPRGRRPELGHQEIFLWVDGENEIRQITNTRDQMEQEQRCRAMHKQDLCFGNGDPSISWFGTEMSFASIFNLAGSNPENYEVHRWLEDNPFDRVTSTRGGGEFANDSSRISGDGTRIALVSDRGQQTGCRRGDAGISRLVLWVEGQPDLVCITETSDANGRSGDESINALGTRIAFASNARDLGNNPAGNNQIFLAEVNLP